MPRCRNQRGFALLITITLLAFLVLLLVSLASLTRVETQVASNNQQISQARQNALVGLNLAIGRLQQLAGPDQRVTGTADIFSAPNVVLRDDSKRNWTGVWQSSYLVDPASATFQANLGWLVSGLGNKNADGSFKTGTSMLTGAVAASSAETKLVTLVDVGSTDTSVVANRVQVESEPIKSATVPGLSGTQTIGNYAYWVGDEGVKARVNLVDPYASAAAGTDAYNNARVVAQRNAIERVATSANGDTGGVLDTTVYPANHADLTKIMGLQQLVMLNGGAQATTLSPALKARFHDLTAHSVSLLTDVARGGLKRDLTAWLRSSPAGATETDDTLIYDPSSTTGDPNSGLNTTGLPKWGMIRTYWNTKADGSPRAAIAQADNRNGLSPVLTYCDIGFDASISATDELIIHVYPVFVVWNPTNVPINSQSGFEVAVGFDNASLAWTSSGSTLYTLAMGTPPGGGFWRFSIPASTVIPAGASLVFRVNSDAAYAAGANPLVNTGVNTGASLTISTGVALTPAQRASGVTISTFPSPKAYITLRDASVAWSEPANKVQTILPGALHTIQYAPSDFGAQTAQTTTSSISLQPRFNFIYYARMTRENISFMAPWIAQQNPRAGAALVISDLETPTNNPMYGGFRRAPRFNSSFGGAEAAAGPRVDTGTTINLQLAHFPQTGDTLFSLAQLQHANLSLLHSYPAYPVGNSLASALIAFDATSVASSHNSGNVADQFHSLYDISYVLNRELWDRYYFSTVPDTLTTANIDDPVFTLPNARIKIDRSNGSPALASLSGADAFRQASAHLSVEAGFNVNSASYQAWRALLASHRDLVVDASNRHLINRRGRYDSAALKNDLWGGQRILTDAQIDRLAWNIVQQIKRRGPSVSLADFVNRRLINVSSDISAYKGVIQAAIDTCDTETSTGGGPPLAPINTDAVGIGNRIAPTTGRSMLSDSTNRVSASPGGQYNAQRFSAGPTAQMPYSSRVAYAPGYLTQADVLGVIGPRLTARSDTFVIRAYGDVLNPVTGELVGKAWCEAVVQRTPEYVAPSTTQKPWDTAAGENATFGRRFKIVSFRWLSESNI
jgi:hypothetical protein